MNGLQQCRPFFLFDAKNYFRTATKIIRKTFVFRIYAPYLCINKLANGSQFKKQQP